MIIIFNIHAGSIAPSVLPFYRNKTNINYKIEKPYLYHYLFVKHTNITCCYYVLCKTELFAYKTCHCIAML